MITFNVKFRFPVNQISANEVRVEIPANVHGIPVFNVEFIEQYRLNDKEVDEAAIAALRSIAVVQQ